MCAAKVSLCIRGYIHTSNIHVRICHKENTYIYMYIDCKIKCGNSVNGITP